jgi:hypothetical protein
MSFDHVHKREDLNPNFDLYSLFHLHLCVYGHCSQASTRKLLATPPPKHIAPKIVDTTKLEKLWEQDLVSICFWKNQGATDSCPNLLKYHTTLLHKAQNIPQNL